MGTAAPGTILNVPLGPQLAVDIVGISKAGLGVDVVFDPAQVLTLRAPGTAGGSNLRFHGGVYDADAFGTVGANSNYGIELGSGCSKIGVYSCTVQNMGQGVSATGATDIEIMGVNLAFSRADALHLRNVARVRVDNVRSEYSTSSWRVAYFNDSTPPIYNVGSAAAGQNGRWLDSSHPDFAQFPDGSVDVIFGNSYADYDGGGLASFGTDESLGITRGIIFGNEIRTTSSNPVYVTGTDLLAYSNKIGPSKLYNQDLPPQFRVLRRRTTHTDLTPRPGDILRGGLNIADGNGIVVDTVLANSTVNMQAAINGPAVTAPEPPRIRKPAWSPLPLLGTFVPPVEKPFMVVAPDLVWFGFDNKVNGVLQPIPPSIANGNNRLTVRRGAWRSVNRALINGHMVRHYWKLNGSIVPGETGASYQAPAGSVVAGIQFSNDGGLTWGLVAETAAVTVGS